MIKKEEIPYTLPTGARLDSGSFEETFRKVLEMLDYEGVKNRKEPNIGIGFCAGIHCTKLPEPPDDF